MAICHKKETACLILHTSRSTAGLTQANPSLRIGLPVTWTKWGGTSSLDSDGYAVYVNWNGKVNVNQYHVQNANPNYGGRAEVLPTKRSRSAPFPVFGGAIVSSLLSF